MVDGICNIDNSFAHKAYSGQSPSVDSYKALKQMNGHAGLFSDYDRHEFFAQPNRKVYDERRLLQKETPIKRLLASPDPVGLNLSPTKFGI